MRACPGVLLVALFFIAVPATAICPDLNHRYDYATGDGPRDVAVADFNRDGRPDVAVANALGGSVSIFIGTGSGTIVKGATLSTGGSPAFLVAADVNDDAKADILVTNNDTNEIAVFLGNGTGGFAAATAWSVAASPYGLAVADFNRDGQTWLRLRMERASSAFVSVTATEPSVRWPTILRTERRTRSQQGISTAMERSISS